MNVRNLHPLVACLFALVKEPKEDIEKFDSLLAAIESERTRMAALVRQYGSPTEDQRQSEYLRYVDAVDDNEHTAWILAGCHHHKYYFNELIKLQSNLNWRTSKGESALDLAVRLNDPIWFQMLLEAKVDCEHEDSRKETVLSYAARLGRIDFLRALIRVGANLEHKDSEGCTALHYAAMFGREDCVRELIKHKAKLNELSTENGCGTALHWAIYYGHHTCVRLLLDAGASLNVEGRAPYNSAKCRRVFTGSAINWALNIKDINSVALLVKHGQHLSRYQLELYFGYEEQLNSRFKSLSQVDAARFCFGVVKEEEKDLDGARKNYESNTFCFAQYRLGKLIEAEAKSRSDCDQVLSLYGNAMQGDQSFSPGALVDFVKKIRSLSMKLEIKEEAASRSESFKSTSEGTSLVTFSKSQIVHLDKSFSSAILFYLLEVPLDSNLTVAQWCFLAEEVMREELDDMFSAKYHKALCAVQGAVSVGGDVGLLEAKKTFATVCGLFSERSSVTSVISLITEYCAGKNEIDPKSGKEIRQASKKEASAELTKVFGF